MRKRIICGLAVAALPVAGVTSTVPSWPRTPLMTARAMAADTSPRVRSVIGGGTAPGRTSDRRHPMQLPLASMRLQAVQLPLAALRAPRIRPAFASARLWHPKGRRPQSRQTAGSFALGDLPRRLTDLTARMRHAVRGMRLTQTTAEQMLLEHHIRWRSSGNCHDRSNSACTSFQGMLHSSLDDLFAFGRLSGCPLTVSGGTENGHARGRLSHGTGHKIDVMPTRCLDTFIPHHFRHIGLRGDNAELYRSREGDVFAREASHWDILIP